MKITVEYSEEYKADILSIQRVKYIGDFVMRLTFNTTEEKLVDFKPFLEQSGHPSIRKYLTESNFKMYKLIKGNLNWNDYDLIFPINHLYENKLIR